MKFYVDQNTDRNSAREAACLYQNNQLIETGFPYKVSWNKVDQSYDVILDEMEIPDEQWDNINRPYGQKYNYWLEAQHKQSVSETELDRLIIDAKNLKMLQWLMPNTMPPNTQQYIIDLQAALDKTYGKGHFWVKSHGHIIRIQCRWPIKD